MRRLVVLIGVLIVGSVHGEPLWPDRLDVDFNYRNSSPIRDNSQFNVRLGLGFESEPTFQGSDSSESELGPFLVASYSADWGNLFLAGDGLGFSRLFSDSFGILLQLEQEDARSESDDPRLIGLGQEKELELEITAKYFLGPWSLGASIAPATGDKGVVGFVGVGRAWRLWNDDLFLSVNADLSASTKDNQQTDFGITPEQSAASGYPTFSPAGGLKSAGISLLAEYEINKRWYLFGTMDYERLLGDVADSPLVENGGSANNVEVAVGLYFRF